MLLAGGLLSGVFAATNISSSVQISKTHMKSDTVALFDDPRIYY